MFIIKYGLRKSIVYRAWLFKSRKRFDFIFKTITICDFFDVGRKLIPHFEAMIGKAGFIFVCNWLPQLEFYSVT